MGWRGCSLIFSGDWKRLDLTEDMLKLKLPMQHVVGYYDFFSRESVNNFVRMQTLAHDEATRAQQQLILGPWDHGTIGASKVGELDFGPEAQWDSFASTLQWFDRHLKRETAESLKPFAPVRYFVIGENRWHESQSWPPVETKDVSYYFHSDGRANTRTGTGRLDRVAPTAMEQSDQFLADPSNPTPACPVTPQRPLQAAVWAPIDQTSIEDRNDVLCYTTETLTEPLTFAGNATAELTVSASTPDADWVVKLVDVHENGTAYNLAIGILRGRFRESELNPKPMKPGETYRLIVDLGPIAAQIASGHRLRVDVCGAYFPLFDRNPNTAEGPFGSKSETSREQVHHNEAGMSRIILPVIDASPAK
ncbi:MAG: CocE/NonD family hydrolase [Pirellulales bacterium]